VIASVERVTGTLGTREAPRKTTGDAARLIRNSTRAASELQWRPHITELDDIISTRRMAPAKDAGEELTKLI